MPFYHIKDIKVKAKFSEDRKRRYLLEIFKDDFDKSKHKIITVIMQNPSIADENNADRAVNFLENLIFTKNKKEFKNVGKIFIVNLFSSVQTRDFSGDASEKDIKNFNSIKNSINNSDIILIAWGKNNYTKKKNEIYSLFDKSKKYYSTKYHPSAPMSSYDDPLTVYKF